VQTRRLRTGQRWALGGICLLAGVAPLAARWLPDQRASVGWGIVLTLAFGAVTLVARRRAALRDDWHLALAFTTFTLVQVLNNSLPGYVGTQVLRDPPRAGNPLASTISGTVIIQLLETAIAVVPILVLTRQTGQSLGSIYARIGRRTGWLTFSALAFLIFYAVTAIGPGRSSRLIPTASLSIERVLALTPLLVVLVISNPLQEELLFRGLFLRKYVGLLGVPGALVLQAVVFSVAHVGVTYSPVAVLFAFAVAFPLGLICGYLMYASDGLLAPVLFHAGADVPIYLAFLGAVSV
jgi:membrane protease YdiL (CAAX protease family)